MNFQIEHSGILIIHDKKILLQKRDTKKEIPFPGTWVLLGGKIEKDENPKQAIIRELQEEIVNEVVNEIDNPQFFQNFIFNKTILQHIFFIEKEIDIESTIITEGEKIDYFDENEIKKLNLGFNTKKMLNTFFKSEIWKKHCLKR